MTKGSIIICEHCEHVTPYLNFCEHCGKKLQMDHKRICQISYSGIVPFEVDIIKLTLSTMADIRQKDCWSDERFHTELSMYTDFLAQTYGDRLEIAL